MNIIRRTSDSVTVRTRLTPEEMKLAIKVGKNVRKNYYKKRDVHTAIGCLVVAVLYIWLGWYMSGMF